MRPARPRCAVEYARTAAHPPPHARFAGSGRYRRAPLVCELCAGLFRAGSRILVYQVVDLIYRQTMFFCQTDALYYVPEDTNLRA